MSAIVPHMINMLMPGGLGLIVTQDDQAHGTLKSTQVGVIYSYHLAINRKVSIRTSLQTLVSFKKL